MEWIRGALLSTPAWDTGFRVHVPSALLASHLASSRWAAARHEVPVRCNASQGRLQQWC